jgi:hypothetical protein
VITLTQAVDIAQATVAHGRRLDAAPLTVVVPDTGGHDVAVRAGRRLGDRAPADRPRQSRGCTRDGLLLPGNPRPGCGHAGFLRRGSSRGRRPARPRARRCADPSRGRGRSGQSACPVTPPTSTRRARSPPYCTASSDPNLPPLRTSSRRGRWAALRRHVTRPP